MEVCPWNCVKGKVGAETIRSAGDCFHVILVSDIRKLASNAVTLSSRSTVEGKPQEVEMPGVMSSKQMHKLHGAARRGSIAVSAPVLEYKTHAIASVVAQGLLEVCVNTKRFHGNFTCDIGLEGLHSAVLQTMGFLFLLQVFTFFMSTAAPFV
ncbi:hypothetical protein H310_02015 [Aphanomyces invadans]|uniref:Uncharacterized protein n=1 Tax=Aphanomyces invadans TaxID=157072 RepID=A0A024UMJ8_9STRA|nr:hypothetical protein H310_02015 [Aphanomyces invadans]ETW07514.1 hypothetical protein H310_02015 [Aphanomyces invadans]|eukprot:XP_008863607.1 hypothetical protein H310_02015 [Aphanomyces invadans]